MRTITFAQATLEAMAVTMEEDPTVFVMGEDIARQGGIFGQFKDLARQFPDRVIDTPISEEGFVGMAVGAAMRGMRPVVELMYDDFATECADPLFNQAAKIRYMTGGQCSVPMVLRPALPIPGELLLPFPWPESCGSLLCRGCQGPSEDCHPRR